MTQTGNRMGRRFEMNVRDQQDGDLVAQLDSLNIRALFVEQEGGNIDGNLNMHGAVFSFIASSSRMRRMCSAADSVERMWPVPVQRGQGM
jgi:hypothetical protein